MSQSPASLSENIASLKKVFGFTLLVFAAEIFGGWWTGSLALLADSMHVGIDLVALGLGILAARISLRPPDPKRTFGYQRVEVLAALGNGVGLWVATGIILREAVLRFMSPHPVAAARMMGFAAFGFSCNLISGLLLFSSSRNNINLRGVFLHVAADAAGTLSALIAGFVILKTGWTKADPIASMLICVGIAITSYWLLRDSIHILLEGAPRHLDLEEIRQALSALPDVKEVHDLHLWSLTQGSENLSGHLVVTQGQDPDLILKTGTDLLESKFGISHVTLQIEK